VKNMKLKLLILGLLLVSIILALGNFGIAAPELGFTSIYVDGSLPTTNPDSSLWDRATALEIPLSGQTVQTPMRFEPFTKEIQVKSLNNGSHIVFLIMWTDSTKNDRTVKIDEFRDAVAIQFAGADRPYICMGAVGQQVNILQWKADWQKDIEEGFQDLQQAFPNFWVDVYPYAVGEPPYQIPEAFNTTARVYLPGWHVGNPFSEPLKVTPIEEAIAQGFGSITSQPHQDSIGRGVWQQGNWKVIIARKLDTSDSYDTPLSASEANAVAFAVWDGSSGDVGARKSVTAWVALNVQGHPLYAWLQPMTPIIIAAVAVVLLVLAFLLVTRRKPLKRWAF